MISKRGGQVLTSGGGGEHDGPVANSSFSDDAPKRFLGMPCHAMATVPAERQSACFSVAHPYRTDSFLRSYPYEVGDQRSNIFLEYDKYVDPRNPETFSKDASFYLSPDSFYPGYYAFESVSNPRHYWVVNSDRQVVLRQFEDTEEFRNSASFAVTDHTIWSTCSHVFVDRTSLNIHCVPKNDTNVGRYNLDICKPILITLGRNVVEREGWLTNGSFISRLT